MQLLFCLILAITLRAASISLITDGSTSLDNLKSDNGIRSFELPQPADPMPLVELLERLQWTYVKNRKFFGYEEKHVDALVEKYVKDAHNERIAYEKLFNLAKTEEEQIKVLRLRALRKRAHAIGLSHIMLAMQTVRFSIKAYYFAETMKYELQKEYDVIRDLAHMIRPGFQSTIWTEGRNIVENSLTFQNSQLYKYRN